MLRIDIILGFNFCWALQRLLYFEVFKFVSICNFPHWMYFNKAMTCNYDPLLIIVAYIEQAADTVNCMSKEFEDGRKY